MSKTFVLYILSTEAKVYCPASIMFNWRRPIMASFNKSAVKRRSTLGALDQYTTPNTKLNTLEMSPPPPPPQKKKKKKKTTKKGKKKNSSSLRCHVKFQTQQIHVATKIVILWNSLRSTHPTNWVWRVTWKLVHFLSDVTGSSTVKSVTIFRYRSFVMCIRTAIYGSFPVLFPIDIQNPHHYWNVVYRQHQFLRRLKS